MCSRLKKNGKYKDIFEEILRICKKGAILDLQVPMHGSLAHTTDITHLRGFAENSFGHFTNNHPYSLGQPYFSRKRVNLKEVTLDGNKLDVAENGFIMPIDPNIRLKLLLHQSIGNLRFIFEVD